jgi:hypothetical protein
LTFPNIAPFEINDISTSAYDPTHHPAYGVPKVPAGLSFA